MYTHQRSQKMSRNNSSNLGSGVYPRNFASPKGEDGEVTFGQSDIYPERKRRLREYLSDTTRAQSSNTDVTYTGTKNKYTIDSTDSLDAENTDTYRRQYEDALGEAFAIFDQNSDGAAINSYFAGEEVDTVAQAKIAKERAEAGERQESPNRDGLPTSNAGRWGRVGKINFPGMQPTVDDTGDTGWKDSEEYWNGFFDGKANYYDEILEKYFLDTNSFNFMTIENDDLRDVQRDIDPEHLEDHFSGSDGDNPASTAFTYGQHYTYAKPFLRPLLLQGLNKNKPKSDDDKPEALESPSELITVLVDFLEVWLQAVLWANASNLFEILSYAESKIIQKIKESGQNTYENAYYFDPQAKDPTHLSLGSSGFHNDTYEALLKEWFETKQGFTSALGVIDGVGLTGILSTFVSEVDDILDNIMNFPSATLRELNVAIPKATMTNLRRANTGDTLVGSVVEGFNIVLSYNTAAVAGMAELLASYLVGSVLDRRNTGFYETMIRSIKRNRVFYTKFLQGTITNNDVKYALGEGNKLVRFFNMCVTIGEISILSNNTYGVSAAENKISLDAMDDYRTMRIAKYRRKNSRKSTFSMDTLPSLNLWTASHEKIDGAMATLGNSSYFSSLASQARQDKPASWKNPTEGNRFPQEEVRKIENELEAELMPFSIQDLRTNEVIGFHAFLNSLTDSYSAEWSSQKGFGRLEAAQIYGGASRTIGLDFTMVSFNETDFNEMWYKINKLTTLVYPQWSEGTLMESSDDTGSFIQPFSQVPTASPLARVRVGDIFTSNYSKQNVARLFGLGNEKATKFKIEKTSSSSDTVTGDDLTDRDLNAAGKRKLVKFLLDRNEYEKAKAVAAEQVSLKATWNDGVLATTPTDSYIQCKVDNVDIKFAFGSDKHDFFSMVETKQVPKDNKIVVQKADKEKDQEEISYQEIDSFFSGENNPIIRSFESNAGRGIACAITSLGFGWGWGEQAWNTDPGARAPRTCTVSLGLTPIHDITPGLDHNGINRAPIYGVGSYMSNQKGDPHHTTDDYNQMLTETYHDAETSLHPSDKEIKWRDIFPKKATNTSGGA